MANATGDGAFQTITQEMTGRDWRELTCPSCGRLERASHLANFDMHRLTEQRSLVY